MKWSWKIGAYRGIPVRIHATFILIIAWVAISQWYSSGDMGALIGSIVFILALFGCVLLHEFGHALMAQKYNIKTRDITLLPIGGVARLERMPDDPRQEFWVALAGPAVNVLIAVVLFLWLWVTNALEPLSEVSLISGPFLERLMVVNIWLVLFNLLPAFPMDGGRVLRAFLAMRMDYARATSIAAGIGQGMALLFGFIGFFSNPFLIFIAFFVWIGAASESGMAQMRSSFDGTPVRAAMITDFYTLQKSDYLARAVELIIAGSQQDFPVLDGGHVVGILTRDKLISALSKHGQNIDVGEVMQRDFQAADSSEMLQTAFMRLQGCDCRIMPVLRGEKLVGLLTMENIGELMMIQSALKGARA